MNTDPTFPATETLDPDDWEAMRRLAHRAVDDGFDHLMRVREPAGLATGARRGAGSPACARAPGCRKGAESAYAGVPVLVMPYPMGNTHPRFWAWFMGNGTPFAAVADFLAAILNPNMGGGNHVANHVEAQVVDWCREIVGFPRGIQWTARQRRLDGEFRRVSQWRATSHAGVDVRQHGVAAVPQRLAHLCVRRGAQLRAEGDRVAGARRDVAAQGAGQRRL